MSIYCKKLLVSFYAFKTSNFNRCKLPNYWRTGKYFSKICCQKHLKDSGRCHILDQTMFDIMSYFLNHDCLCFLLYLSLMVAKQTTVKLIASKADKKLVTLNYTYNNSLTAFWASLLILAYSFDLWLISIMLIPDETYDSNSFWTSSSTCNSKFLVLSIYRWWITIYCN